MSGNTQPQPLTQYQAFTNPNQMSEMLMSNLLLSKLGSVMETNFAFTGLNILKLMLLLSAGEIKNSITTLLTYFVDYIKKAPEAFFNMIMYLSTFIKFNKKVKLIKNETTMTENNVKVVSINIEDTFLLSFCNYVLKSKNCSFKKSTTDATVKNTKDNTVNIEINNIIIKFNDYRLTLVDSLTYGKNIYTDDINSVTYNSIKVLADVKSYLNLLTDQQKDIVRGIYNHTETLAAEENKSTINFVRSKIGNRTYTENNYTEETIANLLLTKYKNFDKDETFIIILIVAFIINNYTSIGCISTSLSQLQKFNTMLFDRRNIYNDQYATDIKKLQSNTSADDYWSLIEKYMEKIQMDTTLVRDIFISFTLPIENISNSTSNINNPNKALKFIVSPNNDIDTEQILTDLIKEIYNSYTKNTTKTKIYYIKLEDDVKTVEINNPEYEDYENKKKILEQLKPTDTSSNMLLYEFMNKQIPPKMIIKETKSKKIECKFLNEMEKDFDTLFLREEDKDKLKNSLDMFKNNGHTLQKLGLQNKFNLLLYGEPGTGKSTTIQAVANYLQKDIYYIDLQKIETNEDLHMVFEYVNKNVNNSGIIVMEDIDAMTDVVLKRTGTLNEYNVNDIISNQKNKLTLEYLLNILQGTLTMDNSIFIVTTNYIDHLDPAFYRDGRFDVKIELKLCDKYQIKNIYKKMVDKELPEKVLELIPNDKFSPANIIYHVKNYIFNNSVDPMKIMEPFVYIS
jgi:SpoVK/Ycf46/Vps4 family AAA+-type ATPase